MEAQILSTTLSVKVSGALLRLEAEWNETVRFLLQHHIPTITLIPQPPYRVYSALRPTLNLTVTDAFIVIWMTSRHNFDDEGVRKLREALEGLRGLYGFIGAIGLAPEGLSCYHLLTQFSSPQAITHLQLSTAIKGYLTDDIKRWSEAMGATLNVELGATLMEFCNEEIRRLKEIRAQINAEATLKLRDERVREWAAEIALERSSQP